MPPARRPRGRPSRAWPRPSEPPLRLRRTPSHEGWSDDELGRLVRSGRAGAGCGAAPTSTALSPPTSPPSPAAGPGHARRACGAPAVVSHQSAAVLHGLPLWDAPARPRARHPPPAGWNDTGRVLRVPRRPTPGRRGDAVDGTAGHRPRRARLSISRGPSRTRPPSSPWTPPSTARLVAARRPPDRACSTSPARPAAERRAGRRVRRRTQRERRRVAQPRASCTAGAGPVDAPIRGLDAPTARASAAPTSRGRSSGCRRVRRADQVRAPAAPRSGRRATPSSRRSAARTRSATRAGVSSGGSGRDLAVRDRFAGACDAPGSARR